MLFNSIEFAIFLPTFFVIYQLARRRPRLQNTLILAASYIFYGWWDVRFLQLIIISTAVDFLAALMISRGEVDRRLRLGASLYVLLGSESGRQMLRDVRSVIVDEIHAIAGPLEGSNCLACDQTRTKVSCVTSSAITVWPTMRSAMLNRRRLIAS